MSPDHSWLPALLKLEDFDHEWDLYFSKVKEVFERDFGTMRPDFRGKRMGLKRQPEIGGMSATFWHFVSEGRGEDDRTPDFRRCERIAWPMAILKAADLPDRVWVWEEQDPRRGTKILLALLDFSYLVVVDDRGDYMLPWTAYPVERKHSREKFAKRYQDALSKKC